MVVILSAKASPTPFGLTPTLWPQERGPPGLSTVPLSSGYRSPRNSIKRRISSTKPAVWTLQRSRRMTSRICATSLGWPLIGSGF